MKQTILFILCVTSLFACEKNTLKPVVDHSTKYIQLEVGDTWIYQMDSIVFLGRGAPAPDTFRYEVKTEVVAKETTALGNNFKIERYTRRNKLLPWKIQRVYSEIVTSNTMERVVDNQREVALSLPVTNLYRWNGNLYNSKDEIDYTYVDVHQTYTVNGIQYDSTIAVDQELVNNAVNRTIGKVIYASNRGVVYQEYENLRNVETTDPVGSKFQLSLLSFEH